MALTIVNGRPGSEAGTGSALLSIMLADLKERKASKTTVMEEYLLWQAAWYALTGKNLLSTDPGTCNFADLQEIADQLYQNGRGMARDFVSGAYQNIKMSPVMMESDVYLSKQLPSLTLPAGSYLLDHPDALQNKIAAKDPMSASEYWLQNRPEPSGRPYRHTDHSTYEYVAPEAVWPLYAACVPFAAGAAYDKKMTDDYISSVQDSAISKAVLKNKLTVEKLQNGDFKGVGEAAKETKDSFTFYDTKELQKAQKSAGELLANMKLRLGPQSRSVEWLLLLNAIDDFTKAKNLDVAAEKSAAVLMAAEKFTKGKKSTLFQDNVTTLMVRDALRAISFTVPDAAHNPSVKPLVDRFNTVRKYRLQDRVQMDDHGYRSALDRDPSQPAPDPNVPAPKKEEFDDYKVESVFGEAGRDAIQMNLYGKAYGDDEADEFDVDSRDENRPVPEEAEEIKAEEPEINEEEPEIKNEAPKIVFEKVLDGDIRKRANSVNVERPKEELYDNEDQKMLYDESEPFLKGEYEVEDLYTLRRPEEREDAYKPVRKFLDALKSADQDKLKHVKKDILIKQFSTMIAVNRAKPLPGEPNMINGLEVELAEDYYKESPAVEMIANTFKTDANFRAKMMKIANTEKEPEKVLSKKMSLMYNAAVEQLKKQEGINEEQEDQKEKEEIIKEDRQSSLSM